MKSKRLNLWQNQIDTFANELNSLRKRQGTLANQLEKTQKTIEENVVARVSNIPIEVIDLKNDVVVAMQVIQ